MLSKYKTEQVGISTEVAIADLTGVTVDQKYRLRARDELIASIKPALAELVLSIPKPIKHIAEDQNPVDFLLSGGQTLSVKSNMKTSSKVAPQNIGQPTANTFWSRLPHLLPSEASGLNLSYLDSSRLFKKVALTRTAELLDAYWKNLFGCDFFIHVTNVLRLDNSLNTKPDASLLRKPKDPVWNSDKVTFSQSLETWNESCTVKYDNVTIGEFQVHSNRNCFKFRFDLNGVIDAGLMEQL